MPGSRGWIANAKHKIAAHVNGSFVTVIARSAPEKPEAPAADAPPGKVGDATFLAASQPADPASAGS
ncbi:MAG: hypothetical protein NTY01_08450 [Verrucomicrobia bacterium]|nr:hypothetical protein [Verrucomicrobiota bacterium]